MAPLPNLEEMNRMRLPDPSASYEPKDLIKETTKTTLIVGGTGLFAASVQNSLARQNLGTLGIFSRFGGTVAMFAAVGGAWAFVSTASANLRQKRTAFDDALGGFASGAVLGFTKRTAVAMFGTGIAVAVVMGFAASTQSMLADSFDPNRDRYQEKLEARHRFRRPMNEMINTIGEGRGIYAPNYYHRRQERIKRNYGIDVPEEPWFMDAAPKADS